MVAPSCDSSTQDAEAGGLEIQDQPGSYGESLRQAKLKQQKWLKRVHYHETLGCANFFLIFKRFPLGQMYRPRIFMIILI